MGIYKQGDHYNIDIRIDGRRIRERGGRTKREAEDALATVRADILRGEFRLPKRAKVKFENFAKKYYEEYSKVRKRSWMSDRVCLKTLVPFFSGMPLGKITPFTVEQYQLRRAKDVAPATVNKDLGLLKHIFTRAIQQKLVTSNPVKEVKPLYVPIKPVRVLSPEEISRLTEACPPAILPVFLCALHTGARLQEVLNLRWADINSGERNIHILKTKTDRDRRVPINDRLWEVLLKQKEGSNSEFVFTSEKTGTKFTGSAIEKAWAKILKKSGVAHTRWHDLRHNFASHLVAAGVDLVTVKDLLGHSSIAMTMRYAHSSPINQRHAVALLNNRFEVQGGQKMDKAFAG